MSHPYRRQRRSPPTLAIVLGLAALGLGEPRWAHAGEPPRARAISAQQPGSGVRSQPPSGEWGWFVVLPSLVAGTALLAYGLSIECAEADSGCQRQAAVAIWGSIGLSSLGTLLGIGIVQAGRAAARTSAARAARAAAPDLQIGLLPSSPLRGPQLPAGAGLRLTGHWL